ncbi:hypothetical protein [Streptomyces tubercidicus]|uniref:hypothetical protein n=1 Tax=Streptomyces tubercidicus TaxID=47759 RepID=UPI0034657C3A
MDPTQQADRENADGSKNSNDETTRVPSLAAMITATTPPTAKPPTQTLAALGKDHLTTRSATAITSAVCVTSDPL